MRFPKLISVSVAIAGFLTTAVFSSVAMAAVGVTSSELQDATNIILPSGDSIGNLTGYSAFSLESTVNLSSGIKARYEAKLSSDPWVDGELPQLQVIALSYGSQEATLEAFDRVLSGSYFSGARTLLDHDDRWIFYNSDTSSTADVFGTIDAEYTSFHLIHANGNILYQASIFREDGEFNQKNLQAYAKAAEDVDANKAILENTIDSVELALGILFPPTGTDLSTKSGKSSLNLSSLYSIASHGELSFDLYVGETDGAVGTIVDSSGISAAEDGDLYLYLNSDGRLFAGIYAPDFDANCTQQAGWYRIESQSSVHSYEWNAVILHYGVGGFWISLNGNVEASCSVSQPYSGSNLYYGDYPNDSIQESMIGYTNDLVFSYSKTDSGLIWDEVLEEQLFLDLPNTDEDVTEFQFLKEAGVFTGSDGMLYPDNNLNRAEMVKILLRAFDYVAIEATVPFWDVPSDAWYLKYLAKAYEIGMVEGNPDGSFAPASGINNAEFYTMLYRIADGGKLSYDDAFRDVESDDWYVYGAAFAAKHDLIDGNYFSPVRVVTRRAAAKALYTLLK